MDPRPDRRPRVPLPLRRDSRCVVMRVSMAFLWLRLTATTRSADVAEAMARMRSGVRS